MENKIKSLQKQIVKLKGGNLAMLLTSKTVDVFKAFKEAGYVAVEPLVSE